MNGVCGWCYQESDEVRGFRIDGEIVHLLCEDCCDDLEGQGADLEGDDAAWDEMAAGLDKDW